MHFTVFPGNSPVFLNHDSCIMIQTGSPFLKQRKNQHDPQFFCQRPEALCRRSWNRFSLIEHFGILRLAKIKPVMQFLQNDQLHPLQSTNPDILFQFLNISKPGPPYSPAAPSLPLTYSSLIFYSSFFIQITPSGYCIVTQCSEPCCLINGKQLIPIISRSGKTCCKASFASSSFGEL